MDSRPRQISAFVERLLQIEVLNIENEQEIFTAVTVLKEGRGSLADALIGKLGRRPWMYANSDFRSEGRAFATIRAYLIIPIHFMVASFLFWFAGQKIPAKIFANSFAENSRLL